MGRDCHIDQSAYRWDLKWSTIKHTLSCIRKVSKTPADSVPWVVSATLTTDYLDSVLVSIKARDDILLSIDMIALKVLHFAYCFLVEPRDLQIVRSTKPLVMNSGQCGTLLRSAIWRLVRTLLQALSNGGNIWSL